MYMQNHVEEFESFVSEGSLEEYLEKMEKLNTWGGDIEIIALCKALNVNVIIF